MKNKICLVEIHLVKIINGEKKFLLLKRSKNEKYAGIWQPITGHVEENEKAFETAFREIYEESGYRTKNIYIVPYVNNYYDHRIDKICEIPVFLCLVDEDFEPKISEEHEQYIWCNADETKKYIAWEGQNKSIEIITKYYPNKKEVLTLIEANEK